MIDYTGRLVDELRVAASAWPAPFTDYTVRGGELQPDDTPKGGKAPQAIIVRRQHPIRRRRIPMASFVFELTLYHPDARRVSELVGLVSDALHDRGPRVAATGAGKVGAWNSADIGGSGSVTEPDTNWPTERMTISVVAPTSVIP